MNKYTFIMEIKGGTYIEQVISSEVVTAKNIWLNHLSNEIIININDAELLLLKREIFESEPVLLQNLSNIWCFSLMLKKNYVLVNIVLTK